ncbi:unnamed protein product [Chrysoparadoxa australica]
MCTEAASGGHLHVLKWLRKGDDPCPWNADTAAAAARGSHLPVLQWLRKGDDPCHWNTDTAASGGHLRVLEWLVRREDPCPAGERLMHSTACWGHLHVMKWAREIDCAWDADVFRWAASGGASSTFWSG